MPPLHNVRPISGRRQPARELRKKVLRQWVDVRCQYKAAAKVVRGRVTVG